MKFERKEIRCREQLKVIIRERESPMKNFLGMTSNISENGVYIISNSEIPINKRISILIATDCNFIKLKGFSKWRDTQPDTMTGTGITILSPPVEYVNFVNKVINN